MSSHSFSYSPSFSLIASLFSKRSALTLAAILSYLGYISDYRLDYSAVEEPAVELVSDKETSV